MRIRTIKPGFWKDEELAEVSSDACLLAVGLLNYADDEGYFNANPALIKADIFPIRETSGSIPTLLQELSKQRYIEMFIGSDNKSYGKIRNFAIHQVINKPTISKIKELYLVLHHDYTTTVVLPSGKEGKGKEGKGKEGKGNIIGDFVDEDLDKRNLEEKNKLLAESEFLKFWKYYPKKKSKEEAKKIYLKLILKEAMDPKIIFKGLYNYIQEITTQHTEEQYIKHASTWLNGKCWDDIPNLSIPKPPPGQKPAPKLTVSKTAPDAGSLDFFNSAYGITNGK